MDFGRLGYLELVPHHIPLLLPPLTSQTLPTTSKAPMVKFEVLTLPIIGQTLRAGEEITTANLELSVTHPIHDNEY